MKVNTITTIGSTLMNRSISEKKPLIITRVKIGNANVSSLDQAKALTTDVITFKKEFGISEMQFDSVNHRSKISIIIHNENVNVGFNMKEVGIFAKVEGDTSDKLLWYINSENDSYFINPISDGLIRVDVDYLLNLTSDSLVMSLDPNSNDNFVTKKYVDDKIATTSKVYSGNVSSGVSDITIPFALTSSSMVYLDGKLLLENHDFTLSGDKTHIILDSTEIPTSSKMIYVKVLDNDFDLEQVKEACINEINAMKNTILANIQTELNGSYLPSTGGNVDGSITLKNKAVIEYDETLEAICFRFI